MAEAQCFSSHPPLTDNRLFRHSPCNSHPPFSRLNKHPASPSFLAGCFLCCLGQGFLEVFKSSHELVAGKRGDPVPCQLLLRSLPDHAHPCFGTCWHRPRFPLLSHPSAPFWWFPSSSDPKAALIPCHVPASNLHPAVTSVQMPLATCPWGQWQQLSSRLAPGVGCTALACRQLEEIRGAG